MLTNTCVSFQRHELGSEVLKKHGFTVLTGESCGYSMRLLFDINQEAKDILSGYFGGAVEFNNRAWNGRDGAEWSVMLDRNMLERLGLYILLSVERFAYILVATRESCQMVGVQPFVRCYRTLEEYQDDRERLSEIGYDWRWYQGDSPRNTHQWSGRIE